MEITIVEQHASFGGKQLVIDHKSKATQTKMRFGLYLPKQSTHPKALLVYLSGLTCTWENVCTKSGFQALASKNDVVVVAPDTSPRGEQDLNGQQIHDDDAYDLGQGAGFYVDASEQPWAPHYSMESYICKDLLHCLERHFADQIDFKRIGITGHSMGGHGALTLGMRHPEIFRSISAFAPICAPSSSNWGQKQFGAYLGDDIERWKAHDACHLMAQMGWKKPILIDQGGDDEFIDSHLKPHLLREAAQKNNIDLSLNIHENYDHSYFFVASFLPQHFEWHMQWL
ncbi:MAG: S-formylglutathione hydrolase [Pseudomonadota bacterium]